MGNPGMVKPGAKNMMRFIVAFTFFATKTFPAVSFLCLLSFALFFGDV
jgi:hypothetical protein